MKKLTSYQAAAILILSRMLSLSMYNSAPGENPTITAAVSAALNILKLILLLPAVRQLSKHPISPSKNLSRIRAVFFAAGAACFLMLLTDSFAGMLETVYPDRFSRFGISVVLLFICAYIASMGVSSLARTASLMLPSFILVFGLIFFEMRDSMLSDRLNLYSPDIFAEIISTVRSLLIELFDVFLLFGLLRLIDRTPEKTVKIYIAADSLMSLVFFMMSASVLGGFTTGSGNNYFSLSYCTHGAVIDRSGAVFLAAATGCTVITGAALLVILKISLRYFIQKYEDSTLYLGIAAVLTTLLVTLSTRGAVIAGYALALSLITATAILAAAYLSPVFGARKESEA